MSDNSVEFDCCECGVHVVQMIEPAPDPRLCCHCLHMPGWYDNPELRAALDPHGFHPGPKVT